MRIKNSEDLFFAWQELKFWQSTKAGSEREAAFIDKEIKNLKSSIREYNNREDDGRYALRNEFDGCIVVIPCGADCTKEEVEEYFQDYERIEYRPTYYDCTGQHFTSWHSIVWRNNQWYLYHAISVDC